MNISRLSCLHPPAKFWRHHPPTSPLEKIRSKTEATKSGNEFAAICRFNLSLFAAFCR
jgi:hypothetical protein